MKPYPFAACAAVLLMLALVMPHNAQQTAVPLDPTVAHVFDVSGNQRIRAVPVATGLVHPWSIAFLPDGHTMLVTEQIGRLRIIHDGVLDPQPVWTAPPGSGNDKLHFAAVHPQF